MRECANMKVQLEIGHIETKPIVRFRGLLQGDPAAPFLFNYALDIPLWQLEEEAQENKWGVKLKGRYRCIILFADNYWIIATSPQEWTAIATRWLTLIRQHGWDSPLDEITVCTTAADSAFITPVKIFDTTIYRAKRKVGFKALGVQVTFDNKFDEELAARIRKTWAAFYKFEPLLLCKAVPLGKRLEILNKCVTASLLWCAGSWNLRKDQLGKIRGVQQACVRKMLHFKRREVEDLDSFMMRTNGTIKNVLQTHNIDRWDFLAHKAVYVWAGWVARLRIYDQTRLSYEVLNDRDWQYISAIAAENNGRQLHGRILRTWRWERPLYKLNANWQDLAQDAATWDAELSNMSNWRSVHR
jgi:hypothetical protein